MKNLLAVLTMTIALTFGATFANAGIIINNATGETPCTESKDKTDWGIIINNITGIIINNLTGIIINNATDETVNCGIIIDN